MATNTTAIRVLEQSGVAPPAPPSTVAEFSLPLTFFDLLFMNYEQAPRLLFYDFPFSKEHFIEKTIPSLKSSLSLTLKHYLPLAGNLLYPMNDSEKPTLLYAVGDSVPITFAECSEDFIFLKGNHARDAHKFYPLSPQMQRASANNAPKSASKLIPILAVQVTLFPKAGIVIGISNHHVIGDANTITNFLKVWASINKVGTDAEVIAAGFLPCYDRAMMKDPNGLDLIIWNEVKKGILIRSQPPSILFADDKVRATFILDSSKIKALKNLLLSKRPDVVHVSTFVVTCAYVWTCSVKARDAVSKEVIKEDELEYFVFVAECRSRLCPPLPATYFGNCFVGLTAVSSHAHFIGNDDFITAAESIANVIHEKVSSKNTDILQGFQNWLLERKALSTQHQRMVGVTGSPKFDIYDTDYGWGKPQKCEHLNIGFGVISLNKSGKSEGGIEVGLVLPNTRMGASLSCSTVVFVLCENLQTGR